MMFFVPYNTCGGTRISKELFSSKCFSHSLGRETTHASLYTHEGYKSFVLDIFFVHSLQLEQFSFQSEISLILDVAQGWFLKGMWNSIYAHMSYEIENKNTKIIFLYLACRHFNTHKS